MAKKRSKTALTQQEKSVIKALLNDGWRNQDIQVLINTGRAASINFGSSPAGTNTPFRGKFLSRNVPSLLGPDPKANRPSLRTKAATGIFNHTSGLEKPRHLTDWR